MATPRLDPPLARAGAATLAWALFVGGWVVLGALGRATSVLWFSGLVPVATWLAVAGVATALGGRRAPPPGQVFAAAMLALAGLAWSARGGGAVAALVVAVGWGVLSCSAARLADDLGAAFAPGCTAVAGSLQDGASWLAFGARWTMLPMMAALAVSSDWCAGLGLSAGQGVALHLAAMLAPAMVLRGRTSPLWVAAFMLAGLLAVPLWPGVRGWMAMSLLHALAWGIAWSRQREALHVAGARARAWAMMAPALTVLALGVTIAEFGPRGLVAVHVVLGAVSLAGAASWILAGPRRQAHAPHKEKLS
jgi:hypothetical protein